MSDEVPQPGMRVGRVSAPIGALRRGLVPIEIETDPSVPVPNVTVDHMIRAARRAPSENRVQLVFALAMLVLGAVTTLLFEPQWRDGKSILPTAAVNLVKTIPGLGPWFASHLAIEQASAEARPQQGAGEEAGPSPDEFLPQLLLELTPDRAKAMNETIPISMARNPAAAAFILPHEQEEARQRAVQCLTAAVYYEAGNESPQGQAAVAQVVLNRMRHPAFPNSVCGVVFEGSERATGCQFTFTCDGSLRRVPDPVRWRRAQGVAEAALNGAVEASVGHSTHYHADYVVPRWATRLTKTKVIGAHIFYRWNGGWGSPGAFSGVYAGAEPQIPGLWPINGLDAPVLVEAPPVAPLPRVTLASLERPIAAPALAEPAVAKAPELPVIEAPTPSAAPAAPPVSAAAQAKTEPAARPRDPREQRVRPRIPVPSNW